MNNLEWLTYEIKQLEKRKENAFRNEYYSIYEECSQKITALQQIKCELEAWEVCKKFIVNLGGEYNLCIDNYHNVNEYQTLKKALEVKDEKEN